MSKCIVAEGRMIQLEKLKADPDGRGKESTPDYRSDEDQAFTKPLSN